MADDEDVAYGMAKQKLLDAEPTKAELKERLLNRAYILLCAVHETLPSDHQDAENIDNWLTTYEKVTR